MSHRVVERTNREDPNQNGFFVQNSNGASVAGPFSTKIEAWSDMDRRDAAEKGKASKTKPSTAKSDKQRAARDALAQAVSDIERQIAADKGELAAHLAAVKHSGEESKRYKKKVAALEKDLRSKKAKLRKLL